MAIQFTATTYADFKTFIANQSFKGDIFYSDTFIAANPVNSEYQFFVYAVDVGRRMMTTLTLIGSSEQKPVTFATDFPAAVQLFGGGASAIAFVGD